MLSKEKAKICCWGNWFWILFKFWHGWTILFALSWPIKILKRRKILNGITCSYANSIYHLFPKTKDFHTNIVCRFILYSPLINSEDLEYFLIDKFNLKFYGCTLKNYFKGTVIKYYIAFKHF